ncbi:MAG: hypothetical protein ACRDQ2_06530 [Gaiellales bacterium]
MTGCPVCGTRWILVQTRAQCGQCLACGAGWSFSGAIPAALVRNPDLRHPGEVTPEPAVRAAPLTER